MSTDKKIDIAKDKFSVRDSNIELFRIISMLLIIAHHYVVNSGLTSDGGVIISNPTTWQSLFLLLFGAWGKTGINCFVLITGYFMCKSQITLKKYAKLILEVYFYRWLGYIVFLIGGYETFSPVSILKMLFPVTNIQQNFTGCYLVFFLCIPFLNIVVNNMTKRQHMYLLLLVATAFILIDSMPTFHVTFNYVTWFCVLYFFASFVRLYPTKMFNNTRFWGWTALVCFVMGTASAIVCQIVPPLFGFAPASHLLLTDSNKILAFAVGFSSFMFFKNVKIKPSKFINAVASTTFGVLLIHANSDAMRHWLWKDTLKVVKMYNSEYLVVYAFISVIAIFAVCSLIDYLRIIFIEKPFFAKCWDKADNKLSNAWKRFIDKVIPEEEKR